MSIFDKFDKYELFAVIVPTICCIFVCMLASWPLIDWLKCAGFIECLPPIVKNAFVTIGVLVYIIVLSTFVQRLSKYFVEAIWFGKNRDKFPTTKYLLHGDSFGNEIVADKIRIIVKKQHDITLLSARQEKNDRFKAVRSIASAVDIIKKEVQKANDDMYNRKNRDLTESWKQVSASLTPSTLSQKVVRDSSLVLSDAERPCFSTQLQNRVMQTSS